VAAATAVHHGPVVAWRQQVLGADHWGSSSSSSSSSNSRSSSSSSSSSGFYRAHTIGAVTALPFAPSRVQTLTADIRPATGG
jgi:hypothetical protein